MTLNFFDPHSGQIGQALRPFVKNHLHVYTANTISIIAITVIVSHIIIVITIVVDSYLILEAFQFF